MKHSLCGAAPFLLALAAKAETKADEEAVRRLVGRVGQARRTRIGKRSWRATDVGGDNLPRRQGRLRKIPPTIFSGRSKESEDEAAPDNREVLRPDQAVALAMADGTVRSQRTA